MNSGATGTDAAQPGESSARTARDRARTLATALIVVGAVLLAVAIVSAVLSLIDDDGVAEVGKPTEVSVQELRTFADESGHAVYWAGTVPGFKLELTTTADGNDYVRYLPEDVAIGDKKPTYTTIGSYPADDAYGIATRSARENDFRKMETAGGGIAVLRDVKPQTVYLAYPGSNVLVEVYAADPRQARDLTVSGRVGPVE